MHAGRVLAVVLLAALPQDPPATPAIELAHVREEKGSYLVGFRTPVPPGSTLKVTLFRRVHAMNWSPWFEEDAKGAKIENVNLTILREDQIVRVFRPRVDVEKFVYVTVRTPQPGLYRIEVTYDPAGQEKVDPKVRGELRVSRELLAFGPEEARQALVDEARKAVEYSEDFFGELRRRLKESKGEDEVYKSMSPKMEEATRRAKATLHAGTYSLMEHLAPYIATEPAEAEGESDAPAMSPNRIDLKTKNLGLSCLRESLSLALQMAEASLREAERLAPLPEDAKTGDRVRMARACVSGLKAAVADLPKLDPTGRMSRLMSRTEAAQVLGDAADLVDEMLRKREVDARKVAEMLARLAKAEEITAHPRESLK